MNEDIKGAQICQQVCSRQQPYYACSHFRLVLGSEMHKYHKLGNALIISIMMPNIMSDGINEAVQT